MNVIILYPKMFICIPTPAADSAAVNPNGAITRLKSLQFHFLFLILIY